jgi:hypothetical protein
MVSSRSFLCPFLISEVGLSQIDSVCCLKLSPLHEQGRT